MVQLSDWQTPCECHYTFWSLYVMLDITDTYRYKGKTSKTTDIHPGMDL